MSVVLLPLLPCTSNGSEYSAHEATGTTFNGSEYSNMMVSMLLSPKKLKAVTSYRLDH